MHIHRFRIPGHGGEGILGDLRLADGPARGLVVLLHGFKGFKDWGFFPFLADSIVARGFAVVGFNASHGGMGEDGGDIFTRLDLFEKSSWSSYRADLDAVLDRIEAREGPFTAVDGGLGGVHLVGHSMGGGLAVLHAAGDRRVASVSLLAAVSHVVRFGDEDRRRWRTEGRIAIPNQRTGQTMWLGLDFLDDLERNAGALDIAAAAGAVDVPALIVHGSGDETVPVEEAAALHSWLPDSRLHVIDGASHSFDEAHPFGGPGPAMTAVAQHVGEFLSERI